MVFGNSTRAQGTTTDGSRQRDVDRHFSRTSEHWDEVYKKKDLVGVIYQQRLEAVLHMVRGCGMSPDARILDIGCGAGLTAVALASMGFSVEALDTVPDMLLLARRNASDAGVSDRITTGTGDIHALRYPENSFDCIIAMGVLPWVPTPELAVREMSRVVKPGGAVIATADNRWRLNNILDPRSNPLFLPVKKMIVRLLDSTGARKQSETWGWANMHSRAQIDGYFAAAGLQRVSGVTIGFGPFSLLGKVLLPDTLGIRVHRRLQELSDRRTPGLRSTGAHYVVFARKPMD